MCAFMFFFLANGLAHLGYLSSGLLCNIVWQKFTKILEEAAASNLQNTWHHNPRRQYSSQSNLVGQSVLRL